MHPDRADLQSVPSTVRHKTNHSNKNFTK